MIRLAIPALAVLIAIVLFLRSSSAYISFTLWTWFLSPFVRRLVDWQFGWQEQSVVLLTPFLVTSVAVVAFLRPARKNVSDLPPALLLCTAGVLYGFLIGMYLEHSAEIVFGLLNWLAPLLFGAYIASDWRNYPENRAAVLKTSIWSVGVMGIYGIYQWIFAPPWDVYWLQNVSLTLIDPSFGQPNPFEMRVWSTMNAPGPFAGGLMTMLIISTIASSPVKVPFAVAGYVSFLLSAVRAAWLGWAVGLALLLRKVQPKLLVRVVGLLILLALCVVPIIRNPQLAPGIGDRLKSLTDVKQDASLRERQDMYRTVTGVILHNPFGHGLRNQETVQNLAVDSGILATLLSMGWLGAFLYLAGVAHLLFSSRGRSQDAFIAACRAVCFAAIAQFIGSQIFTGMGGAIFWLCAASCIAEKRWSDSLLTRSLDPVSEARLVAH